MEGILLKLKKVFSSKIFIAVTALLGLIYLYIRASLGGDFTVYLAAAEALYHHRNCYNVWFTFQGEVVTVQYSYSPAFAMLLIPFSQIPALITQFAFLLSFPFMIWRMWTLTSKQLSVKLLSPDNRLLWSILLAASTARFFLHNVEMIQVNLLLLYLTMEGLYQVQVKGNKFLGGFLIALGCIIKILPVVFIPYLVFRKEFKAALFTTAMLCLMLLLPLPFFGLSFTSQLLSDWWDIINPARPEYTYLQHVYGGERIQSLSAFVSVFLSTSSFEGVSANLASLNPHQVNMAILILQVLLVIFTLYFLKSFPFSLPKNKIQSFYEQSYIFLITPLIFPHQQKYAFVYIFPAYAFIYAFVIFKKQHKIQLSWVYYVLLILSFILLTISTDGLTGTKIGLMLQYFKVITFGTFTLIILLALFNKDFVLAENHEI